MPGPWETALALAEQEVTGAPFHPGDRVIDQRNPAMPSLIVERCEPHMRGGFYLTFTNGESGPAHAVALVPDDWEDAPTAPAGCVAYGLSDIAWRQKRANDAADPVYLAAYRRWLIAMIGWAEGHLSRLDPQEATLWGLYCASALTEIAHAERVTHHRAALDETATENAAE